MHMLRVDTASLNLSHSALSSSIDEALSSTIQTRACSLHSFTGSADARNVECLVMPRFVDLMQCRYGNTVEQDLDKVIEYSQRAMLQDEGNGRAPYMIGDVYAVRQRHEEAHRLFVQSAVRGHAPALSRLARHYFSMNTTEGHRIAWWIVLILREYLSSVNELYSKLSAKQQTLRSEEDAAIESAILSLLPMPIYEEVIPHLFPVCPQEIAELATLPKQKKLQKSVLYLNKR
jgi:hypothetical protein